MLIETRDQFEAARTILIDADIIAVDLETNGKYVHEGHVMCGISTFCELAAMGKKGYGAAFYFPFRHKPGGDLFSMSENIPEDWLRELKPIISSPDKEIIFHNAKFDLGFLRQEGMDVAGRLRDTLIMGRMWDDTANNRLKPLAAAHFGEDVRDSEYELKKMLKPGMSYADIPPRLMEPYACKDAELTYRLYEKFTPLFEQEDLTDRFDQAMDFLRCLFEIEWGGVLLNKRLAESLAQAATSQMRQLEDAMGFDPGKRAVLARNLFAAPPVGLGLLPHALTNTSSPEFPHGIPVMDEAVLSTYDHPLVTNVLTYRGLVKANSTWYTGFQQKAHRDGRIHPTFNQFGTRTGRLSCSDPNLQQLPRDVESTPVKKLLIAPERHSLWEFDYSQIEFRIATCYAGCEPLKEIFRSGVDIFTQMAGELNLERQSVKTLVYAILYGAMAPRIAEALGVEIHQAQTILDDFNRKYPGFPQISKVCENAARQRGYVKTWTGRRRRLVRGFCKKHQKIDNCAYHKAFNSVIQGGAGDVVEETMLRFWREPKHPTIYRMVSQVHDSLWFEVSWDFEEHWVEEIKSIMEWPIERFEIPFPTEAHRVS